jgi:hypothetical protein
MAMEPQGLRPEPEYSARRFIEITRGDQIIDGWTLNELRIERQHSIRPETPGIILAINLRLQVIRSNGAERPRETSVSIYKTLIKFECLHCRSRPPIVLIMSQLPFRLASLIGCPGGARPPLGRDCHPESNSIANRLLVRSASVRRPMALTPTDTTVAPPPACRQRERLLCCHRGRRRKRSGPRKPRPMPAGRRSRRP